VLCALVLAWSGCPGGKQPVRRPAECEPPPIEVFLQADDDLNRNAMGQPMPVEVRVLLLRQRQVLDQADFETIWKEGPSVLGKDLVSSATLTVFPGKLKIYPMKSVPGVSHIALVGIFRKPRGRGWCHVVDVSDTKSQCAAKDALHTIIHAHVRGNSITQPD